MASLVFFFINVYSVIVHLDLINGACFDQSSIAPPTTNITQIALVMNRHELQYIDLSTLAAWSLNLQIANETFSPPWATFTIINSNNLSTQDTAIIPSQRYTTAKDITYILHPLSQSLLLYNATSHELYIGTNTSSMLYPSITSAYCIANNNTHLFVSGGMASTHFSSALQIYDITFGKWFLGQNMSTARVGHGCNYDGNNFVYVYGGWRDLFDYANFIERYSIKHNQWGVFMDKTNVVGTDLYRGFSRECISTTKYPLHATTCVEYPNVKDNAFNGEISVVNHEEKLAMNTLYKMNNFVGMILYDVDRLENNYSLLLLFGSSVNYSLVDRTDGSMWCYFPPEDPTESRPDSIQAWLFFTAAVILSIIVFSVLIACHIRKKCRKQNKGFQKVDQDAEDITEIKDNRIRVTNHRQSEHKHDQDEESEEQSEW